jgi:tetratricopeptide (TPR) repeat protein
MMGASPSFENLSERPLNIKIRSKHFNNIIKFITLHMTIFQHKPTLYAVILPLFAFLLYANTISFDYALDDKIAITYNNFTKKGISGIGDLFENDAFVGFFGKKKNLVEGGRYRPLSMAYFAVVWEFWGPRTSDLKSVFDEKSASVAHILHASNALFYALTALVLFLVLQMLAISFKQGLDWAFLSTMIFVAHPLHTEVVANIKSLDEILAFLFGLSGLYFTLKFWDYGAKKHLVLAFFFFVLAFFSKESLVTFLGVVPLVLMFFRSEKFENRFWWSMLPVVGAFTLYFLARMQVLDGFSNEPIPDQLMNKPFMHAKGGEKLATIFLTMFLYLKLLVFPHPLTHDYYPWHPLTTTHFQWGQKFPYAQWDNPLVWLGLILYALILFYGLRSWLKKNRTEMQTILGFSALFFIGTFILFSNLFFEIGAFMNERFMYVPSLGFAMVMAIIPFQRLKRLKTPLLGLILALFSYKTFTRNQVWKNDQTLAIADYKTSKNSAKVNMAAGGAFYDLAKKETNIQKRAELLQESRTCLNRSLQLFPNYIQSKTLLGHSCYEAGLYAESIAAYESGLKQDKSFKDIEQAIFYVVDTLKKAKKTKEAIAYLEMYIRYFPDHVASLSLLGELYGKDLGDLAHSKEYLTKAYTISPKSTDVLIKLGTAHAMTGDFKTALGLFNQALAIDSTNKNAMLNLGITYMNLGDVKRGQALIERSKK